MHWTKDALLQERDKKIFFIFIHGKMCGMINCQCYVVKIIIEMPSLYQTAIFYKLVCNLDYSLYVYTNNHM